MDPTRPAESTGGISKGQRERRCPIWAKPQRHLFAEVAIWVKTRGVGARRARPPPISDPRKHPKRPSREHRWHREAPKEELGARRALVGPQSGPTRGGREGLIGQCLFVEVEGSTPTEAYPARRSGSVRSADPTRRGMTQAFRLPFLEDGTANWL